MKAQIIGIYDRGVIANERLHFKVLFDMELSYLIAFDTFYVVGGVSSGNGSGFWFPPKQVKAGSNIVLYTRFGQASDEMRPDGSQFHFLFRGLSAPLYSNRNACTVLHEIQTWATTNQG